MSGGQENLLMYAEKQEEKALEPCAYVLYFKCTPLEKDGSAHGGCGRNISLESATMTTVVCPNCGKVWQRGEIGWSGAK